MSVRPRGPLDIVCGGRPSGGPLDIVCGGRPSGGPLDPSELERRLLDPGWTPSARQIPGLLEVLRELEADRARTLVRALSRAGPPAARAALGRFDAGAGAGRERWLDVVAGVAVATARGAGEEFLGALERALSDSEPRCRRIAARALGKLGRARSEDPLLEALTAAALPEQRAIVEALGKLGGGRSVAVLAALRVEDAELGRRVEKARALLARRAGRERPGGIELDVPLPRAERVRLYCRRGLAELVRDELAPLGGAVLGPDFVELRYAGTLRELLRARTALGVALVAPWPSGKTRASKPSERIASALVAPATLAALRAWTSGALRYRVQWRRGQRRALTWELARAVAAHHAVGPEHPTAGAAELENDPRAAVWEFVADPEAERETELVPRLDPDPRFEYRRAGVPAASHPTLAAALARLGGVRPDDRVWDPFVGSALELVERARLGPYASLRGSDLDARALDAARANLDAAGVRAELVQGDALSVAPPGVTLILTNPPMGRRLARDGSIGALLENFVAHAARVLVPGGRMVWLSPLDRRTERAALRAGLRVERGPEVDMGGFGARVQILRR